MQTERARSARPATGARQAAGIPEICLALALTLPLLTAPVAADPPPAGAGGAAGDSTARAAEAAAPESWRALEEGLDLGVFPARRPPERGDGRITILRASPSFWSLEYAGPEEQATASGRTAREWCETLGFTAAVNAGMFATDYRTHLGYARLRDRIASGHLNAYRSLAAFDPRRPGIPLFRIFDLDEPGVSLETVLGDYASAVQNLRLIARPGYNRWSPQPKRWSEAALGEDEAGRILVIFCRSPYTMHELNEELVRLGVVAAQHLEGGPEAQLFVRSGDFELELIGSYETAFHELDDNQRAWPVPNALGLRRRTPLGP